MPLSLAFRFPAGRYHATPFGHHVNEGLIEWPPSPWRLLRSLISIGYTSGVWDGSGPPALVECLVEKLSAEPPNYFLPPAVGAHSRHYMPIGGLGGETRVERTTLVFDSWVRVEDQELVATWPDIHLADTELSILGILMGRLNYLGRSESWVEGRVMGSGESTPEANCFPETCRDAPGLGWEQDALLAPTTASRFKDWRAAQLRAALADLPLPEGKKPTTLLLKQRAKAVAPYPDDLLDCLQKDTNWLRRHGWNWPPGSRRVFYWRHSDAITVGSPKARSAARPGHPVEAMLLSLTSASRNDHVLPSITRTLPQAELLHRSIVSVATRKGVPPPELTGRDENWQPLQGPHRHAHINPLDLDRDGHLDHILIWAPGGLGADAQAAIRGARRTFTKGGLEPLRLGLAGMGDLGDLLRLSGQYGQAIRRLQGKALHWQSATPFVPPRHIKARGKNTLEGQIRAELRSRGFPEVVAVRQLAPKLPDRSAARPPSEKLLGDGQTTWRRFRHFALSRRHGPEPLVARGFAISIEFERPVSGPIAIGYASHFGLGLFEQYENTG